MRRVHFEHAQISAMEIYVLVNIACGRNEEIIFLSKIRYIGFHMTLLVLTSINIKEKYLSLLKKTPYNLFMCIKLKLFKQELFSDCRWRGSGFCGGGGG